MKDIIVHICGSLKVARRFVTGNISLLSLLVASFLLLYTVYNYVLPVPVPLQPKWYYSEDVNCKHDYNMTGNWSDVSVPYFSSSSQINVCFTGIDTYNTLPLEVELMADDCVSSVAVDGQVVYSDSCYNCKDCNGRIISLSSNETPIAQRGKIVLVAVQNPVGYLEFRVQPSNPLTSRFILLAFVSISIIFSTEFFASKRVVIALLIIVASTAYLLPILDSIGNLGRGDWDHFQTMSYIPLLTVFKYGQLPLWNPYLCGGTPLLAYYQASFLDPLIVIDAIFGVAVGLKIKLLFYMIIGILGCYLLGSYLGMNTYSRYLFGMVFMFSGFFAHRVMWEGHLNMMAIIYLPYILLFLLKSFDEPKYIVLCSIFSSLFLIFGNHFILGLLILLLLLLPFLYSSSRIIGFIYRREQTLSFAFRPILVMLSVLVLVGLLTAFHSLPLLEYYLWHPNLRMLSLDDSGFDSETLYGALVDPNIAYSWHEINGFVGVLAFFFAIYGIFISSGKKQLLPLVIILLIFVFVSMGGHSPLDIWGFLQNFFPFSSLHIPQRTISFIVFFMSLFCGLGASTVESRDSRLVKLALIVIVSMLFIGNALYLHNAFVVNPGQDQVQPKSFTQIVYGIPWGRSSDMLTYARQEVGVLNCYAPGALDPRASDSKSPDYLGETYLLNNQGSASIIKFTPNLVEVQVNATGEDTLVLNQNYEQNWKVDGGTVIESQGLLSTMVSPGVKKIVFYYLPRSFIVGALITSIAVIYCLMNLMKSFCVVTPKNSIRGGDDSIGI